MSGINNIFSTVNSYTNKSRFCYAYTPQGPIDNCCQPTVCADNTFLQTVSSLPMVVNNNTKTTERSLLLGVQQQNYQANYSTAVNSTLQYTTQNINAISNTIYGQMLGVRQSRYEPYQPIIPMCPPQSVIDLQMNTRNIGVPMPVFTIANCKGSQSVTTSDVNYI
jgi:hypothetical protein